MQYLGRRRVQRLIVIAAVGAALALFTASNTIGALINGALPTTSFTYASVEDNTVSISTSGVNLAQIAALKTHVKQLSAIAHPTAAQTAALARYKALLAEYQSRYAASLDLRTTKSSNVKTTYSRVPPADTYESGWHYHNGPVIVTVTVGTLTFFDSKCGTWDVTPGHTYIESPRQVLDAKALPAKNAGIQNVEWFTTRLYQAGAIDPVPVAAPCTP